MTDPDDTRAEQAFRDAFAQRADDVEPVTLEVPERSRRSRWLVLGAAAAVLAVVVGSVALGTWAPDRSDPAGRVDRPVDVLPPAEPGWRWATWRDVGVQVPETWIDGHEPGPDWCADVERTQDDDASYVSYGGMSFGVTMAIGCEDPEAGRPAVFGEAPIDRWAPHLAFDAVDSPDGDVSYKGWTVRSRTMGVTQLRLLTDGATDDLSDSILGSARRFTVDDKGCASTSWTQTPSFVRPEQPFDVMDVESVESVSICQYARGTEKGEPGLIGSRLVDGKDAADLLAGIQAAPPGGGPDKPEQCTADSFGSTAIVVRLEQPERTDDLVVYFDHCFGNGYDDGTTKRTLTAGNCAPLFGGTVVAWSFSGFLGSRCAGGQPDGASSSD